MEQWMTMRRLLRRFTKHAQRILSDRSIEDSSDLASLRQKALLFLYVKSTKTAASIRLLLLKRRWEDAMILLRSLLENLICYQWLRMRGDPAIVRFARFECVTKLREHKKSREATIFKRNAEEFDYLAAQANIEQELMNWNDQLKTLEPAFDLKTQEDLDNRGLWGGRNIRQMAEEIDRTNSLKDLTWIYDIPFGLGNEFVHPNPATVRSYLKTSNRLFIPVFKTTHEWQYEIQVLTCQTLLEMMRLADGDFHLGKSELDQQLSRDFESLLRKKDNE
jgi:peroxiredoxin family protein